MITESEENWVNWRVDALNGKAGKGDTPRPSKGDAYRKNYERIFKEKTINPLTIKQSQSTLF